jgi:hypothetical protein
MGSSDDLAALFQTVAAQTLAKPALTGLGRYQLPRFGTAVARRLLNPN